jgi:hypothetical protein
MRLPFLSKTKNDPHPPDSRVPARQPDRQGIKHLSLLPDDAKF